APDDGAVSHRKTEVITGGAREADRTVQPQRALRILPGHFERRALVLLHGDGGRAVGRAVDTAVAENSPGGDWELSRGGAIGVGRESLLLDSLVVRVDQRDGHSGGRRHREAPEIAAPGKN